MNNKKMFLMAVPALFTVCAIAQPLYAPPKDWPPCAVMTAEGEKVPDGQAVTGVICRSTSFIPDSDGDGVSNKADQCPDTRAGAKVDSVGCPLDSDNDGVPDYIDQCASTPAGIDVDSSGCPLDNDSDSVPDYQDQCPDTSPGAKVNEIGCSKPRVLNGVHFEFDSAKLTPESHKILDKAAESLHYHPNLEITVAGYTDSIGATAYNQLLSQRRAEAVMHYLASHGIDPSMLKAVGYGEKHPIASNDTKEGRAKNRRVELHTPQDQ